MSLIIRYTLLFFGLLTVSITANANAGIPMLALSWPVQWLAFFPVVAGEAALLSSSLGQPYRSMLKPVAIANLASTLVGVPVAWFSMLLVEGAGGFMLSMLPEHIADSNVLRYATFPLFAAWIGGSSPFEVKVAFLVLMGVFCWVSIFTERWVLARYVPTVATKILSQSVVQANVVSYVVLCAVTIVVFTVAS